MANLNPRRRVVLAGGSGLIGRRLTSELLHRGWEVVVLSRSMGRGSGEVDRLQRVVWNPVTRGDWEQALVGADGVIQLSGESLASGRWSRARKLRFWESRVTASRNLAEAVMELANREQGLAPSVFIQGSAVGVYGNRADERLNEASDLGIGYLAELCRAWESSSREVVHNPVRHMVLRTGLVLAPEGPFLKQVKVPFLLGLGGPMGFGKQWMPWIHIEDVVAAILFLLEDGSARGPWNLTSPNPVTNEEFSRDLASALARRSWLRMPVWVLRLVLGEMSGLMLEGQRAMPKNLLQTGFRFQFPVLSDALADLLDTG